MSTLLRDTRAVRPLAQVAAVGLCLVALGTDGLAPQAGLLAEPVVVTPEPAGPDPLRDPPLEADLTDIREPRVRARAAMVYNPRTHEVLWDQRGHERRPIASITKVMTALVFLEQDPDLTRDVVVSRRDVQRSSTTYLRRGERVRLRDVLHLALVASDNVAARVLARASQWGTRGFVEQMNRKARELGLISTGFSDPSGLHQENQSTAYDVSRLIAHAATHPRIAEIMRKSSYQLRTSRRSLTVRNTNRLLLGRLAVLGGKTGYIDASGYCLATLIDVPDGEPLAVVVLGVGSNTGRFREITRLVDWVSTHGRSLLVSADARTAD